MTKKLTIVGTALSKEEKEFSAKRYDSVYGKRGDKMHKPIRPSKADFTSDGEVELLREAVTFESDDSTLSFGNMNLLAEILAEGSKNGQRLQIQIETDVCGCWGDCGCQSFKVQLGKPKYKKLLDGVFDKEGYDKAMVKWLKDRAKYKKLVVEAMKIERKEDEATYQTLKKKLGHS